MRLCHIRNIAVVNTSALARCKARHEKRMRRFEGMTTEEVVAFIESSLERLREIRETT